MSGHARCQVASLSRRAVKSPAWGIFFVAELHALSRGGLSAYNTRLSKRMVAMSLISAPVSFGELIDKITILEIKSGRMRDAAKLANVRAELDLLNATWAQNSAARIDIDGERAHLKAVNEALWEIEDRIRVKEKARAFDAEFIELARSVYLRNDERAAAKREINLKLGSQLVEEKSYQDYR
jgi:hypothetical protein